METSRQLTFRQYLSTEVFALELDFNRRPRHLHFTISHSVFRLFSSLLLFIGIRDDDDVIIIFLFQINRLLSEKEQQRLRLQKEHSATIEETMQNVCSQTSAIFIYNGLQFKMPSYCLFHLWPQMTCLLTVSDVTELLPWLQLYLCLEIILVIFSFPSRPQTNHRLKEIENEYKNRLEESSQVNELSDIYNFSAAFKELGRPHFMAKLSNYFN